MEVFIFISLDPGENLTKCLLIMMSRLRSEKR